MVLSLIVFFFNSLHCDIVKILMKIQPFPVRKIHLRQSRSVQKTVLTKSVCMKPWWFVCRLELSSSCSAKLEIQGLFSKPLLVINEYRRNVRSCVHVRNFRPNSHVKWCQKLWYSPAGYPCKIWNYRNYQYLRSSNFFSRNFLPNSRSSNKIKQ